MHYLCSQFFCTKQTVKARFATALLFREVWKQNIFDHRWRFAAGCLLTPCSGVMLRYWLLFCGLSLPSSINGEIVFVCYWYSVMTAPTECREQLSKINHFKRKVSRPCLSHFACQQTELHLHTIVLVRTGGGIQVDMQKPPSIDFRLPFY